jgi:hypothetical protein
MSTTTPTDFDVSTDEQHDLDERDVRALVEKMTVLSTDAPGIYEVSSGSGAHYTVDARHGSCTCPDAEHRDVRCKHIRRARFACGRRPIPEWVSLDAVDPLLGEQVDGPTMADGGVREARAADSAAELDSGDEDEDGCLCDDTDLGCFEHFQGGAPEDWEA